MLLVLALLIFIDLIPSKTRPIWLKNKKFVGRGFYFLANEFFVYYPSYNRKIIELIF
jgi:hypothetical protein